MFIDNFKRNRDIKRLFNCKDCNEYIIPFATYVSIPMQKYMSTVPEICELKKQISTYNKIKNNWESISSESRKSNDIFIKNYGKMLKQLNNEYAKVSKKVYPDEDERNAVVQHAQWEIDTLKSKMLGLKYTYIKPYWDYIKAFSKDDKYFDPRVALVEKVDSMCKDTREKYLADFLKDYPKFLVSNVNENTKYLHKQKFNYFYEKGDSTYYDSYLGKNYVYIGDCLPKIMEEKQKLIDRVLSKHNGDVNEASKYVYDVMKDVKDSPKKVQEAHAAIIKKHKDIQLSSLYDEKVELPKEKSTSNYSNEIELK